MRSENVLIPRSISIHAPPRGATNQPPRVTRIGIISIHAPPRGATWSFPPSRDYPTFQFTPLREGRRASARCVRPRHRHFNSRPSARGDRQGNPRWATETISIHAPPRGATKFAWISLLREHFNSRPSARGDSILLARQVCVTYFNSRPSARGDGLVMPRMPSLLFQFTPLREGRHKAKFEGMRLTDISIHAPPRGATICLQNIPACINFNSRPSARGDREAHPMAEAIGKFQFTPLREGRPCRVR